MGFFEGMDAIRSLFQRGSRYTPLPTNAAPIGQSQSDVLTRRRRTLKIIATGLMVVMLGYLAVAPSFL